MICLFVFFFFFLDLLVMVVMRLLFCNVLVAVRNLNHRGLNSTLVKALQISARNPF